MPGREPSIRRYRFIKYWAWALAAVAVPAAAEDLLQVFRDAQRYDAVYSSARYTLVSHSFAIADSSRLSILGVTARRSGGATVLRFFTANPAPDPNMNLWDRARTPDGGAILFTHDGAHGRATFDTATHAWIARLPGDATSGTIRVPQDGFTDRWGNTSGPAVGLRIGAVASQHWPPVMPVGGFCVPGPFGHGCFWPQAVYPWPPGSYPPGKP